MTIFPNVLAALAERSAQETFMRALRKAARAFWGGQIDRTLFNYTFSNELEYYLTRAFVLGAKDVGIKENEILGSEKFQMRIRIIGQLNSIGPFADFIQLHSKANGGSLPSIYVRVSMWHGQYLAMRNFAKALIGKDKKLIWVEGDTKDKCSTCLKLDGKVFRASQWKEADVYPQHPQLECHGIRCRCKLMVTTADLTSGEVPSIP